MCFQYNFQKQDNSPELLRNVKFSAFTELHLVLVDAEPDF